jgi:glycosyltransferase involved in cell wall biosynthesis
LIKHDNPLVTIILVNWNGKDDTLECLASLESLDYPNREVIIVDNGSTDNSTAEINKRYPLVRIIKQTTNLGFAEANNIGAGAASGKYLFLLNFIMSVAYWDFWLWRKSGFRMFVKAIISQVHFSFDGLNSRNHSRGKAKYWLHFVERHTLSDFRDFNKRGGSLFDGDLAVN